MTEDEARALLIEVYGDDRKAAEDEMCFGDCCLRGDEKKALITVIYGQEPTEE